MVEPSSTSEAVRRWLGRIPIFLELSKAKIIDLWVGALMAWSLIPGSAWHGANAAAFVSLLLAWVFLAGLTCTLDDIVGIRDGVDAANHSEGPRFGVSKPLLDGRLHEGEALWYAAFLAAGVTVTSALAFVLASDPPGWLVVGHILVCVVAVNYSWGLKLSYRGGGEITVLISMAGTVVIPMGMVMGEVSSVAWFNAFLVGLWMVEVVICSNTKDAAGDRATGRMTIAARTTVRGNRIYITSVFVAGWIVSWAALFAGVVPGWYAMALIPIGLSQAYQLVAGVLHQQWLRARLMGFWIFRLGVLLMVLCNLMV